MKIISKLGIVTAYGERCNGYIFLSHIWFFKSISNNKIIIEIEL